MKRRTRKKQRSRVIHDFHIMCKRNRDIHTGWTLLVEYGAFCVDGPRPFHDVLFPGVTYGFKIVDGVLESD